MLLNVPSRAGFVQYLCFHFRMHCKEMIAPCCVLASAVPTCLGGAKPWVRLPATGYHLLICGGLIFIFHFSCLSEGTGVSCYFRFCVINWDFVTSTFWR